MEKALHGLAEAGVPETVDLWPAINERVAGRRPSEARASEEPAGATIRQRVRPSRLVPDSLFGWVLAAFSVLILGAGVYAASGLVGELFRQGLPGTVAPGSDEGTNPGQADGGRGDAYGLFRSQVPGGEGSRFEGEIGQTQTADGAKVTLGWAYADAKSVVVTYTVEDLEGGRRVGEHPAELQPLLGYGTRREQEYLREHGLGTDVVELTDGSGTDFRMVDNSGQVSEGPDNMARGPLQNMAAFEPDQRLEPTRKHRFRLTIPLIESAVVPLGRGVKRPEPEPVGELLVFGFEVPVHPIPVFEVGEEATASGITLTLKRVKASPGRPEAVVCLEPTDGVRGWFPVGKDLGFEAPKSVAGEGDCLEMLLNDPLTGPSSVTVEQIEINPASDGPLTRGPWTFEFEVPEAPGS